MHKDESIKVRIDDEKCSSENQLAKIINAIPLVLVEFDVWDDESIHIEYLSSGINKLLPELKVNEVYEDSAVILSRVNSNDIGLVNKALDKAIKEQIDLFVEFRFDIGQDEVYWVELTGEAEVIKGGKVKFRGFFKGVSDRKNVELSLCSTIETYTSIFNSVNYGIILLSDDMIIHQANPTAMKILGIGDDFSTLNKKVVDFIWDDIDSEGCADQINKVFTLKQKTQIDILASFIRQPRIVDLEYYNLNWELNDTKIIGYLTISDTSDEVIAHRALQKRNFIYTYFSNAINEVVFDLVLDSGEIHWGEGVQQLLGCSDNEVPKYDDMIKYAHPDDLSMINDCYHKAAKSIDDRIWKIKFRRKKPDNTYVYIENVFTVIKDLNNKPAQFIGVLKDITDSVLVKKERVLSIYDALKKEREYFSMEIHDNIGQHLVALNIYLKQLEIEPHEKLFDKTNSILQNTIKETRLLAYHMKPPELEEGLLSAIQLMVFDLQQMKEQNIHLVVDPNLKSKDFLYIDEFQNYRIIQEFINNSIKHSAAENIKMNIKKEGQSIFVEIKDDGRGFDMNEFECYGMGMKNMIHRSFIANSFLCCNSELNKGSYLKIKISSIIHFC